MKEESREDRHSIPSNRIVWWFHYFSHLSSFFPAQSHINRSVITCSTQSCIVPCDRRLRSLYLRTTFFAASSLLLLDRVKYLLSFITTFGFLTTFGRAGSSKVQLITFGGAGSSKVRLITSGGAGSLKVQLITSGGNDSSKVRLITSGGVGSSNVQLIISGGAKVQLINSGADRFFFLFFFFGKSILMRLTDVGGDRERSPSLPLLRVWITLPLLTSFLIVFFTSDDRRLYLLVTYFVTCRALVPLRSFNVSIAVKTIALLHFEQFLVFLAGERDRLALRGGRYRVPDRVLIFAFADN